MSLYSLVKKYGISRGLFVTYFVFLALIFYFICVMFFGQKGLFRLFELSDQLAVQEMVKKELANEIKVKKNKVEGMNSESLDLDLLDEEARKNLGYSGRGEIVVYKGKKGDGGKKDD